MWKQVDQLKQQTPWDPEPLEPSSDVQTLLKVPRGFGKWALVAAILCGLVLAVTVHFWK